MQAIGSIIGMAGQGQAGQPIPKAPIPGAGAPIAPGAPGAPGNRFGAGMGANVPTETKDSFGGGPGKYERSGMGAGLDIAARLAKAAENPALALVERLAGDKEQVGTFANEHPQVVSIVQGLFQ